MKAFKKLGIAVVGSSMLFGAVAFAGEGYGHGKGMSEEFKAKYDTNKDGKLDDAEKAAFKADRAAQHKQRVAQYDTNKDGNLDDQERANLKAAKLQERFKSLDKNNDGQLSIDEFKAGHEQMRMGRMGKHHR